MSICLFGIFGPEKIVSVTLPKDTEKKSDAPGSGGLDLHRTLNLVRHSD